MQNINNKNGYTLIETMIAVSLFIIIVTIGMGALLNANRLNQKSKAMRSILDNLSFVMEDMSRNLRTGYSYSCVPASLAVPSSPTSGQSCVGIAFEPSGGSGGSDPWIYEIVNTTTPTVTSFIQRSTDNGRHWMPLTPSEITFSAASGFSILGAESKSQNGDTQQPFVTIRLVGTITSVGGVSTPFDLQTSLSQRQLDFGS